MKSKWILALGLGLAAVGLATTSIKADSNSTPVIHSARTYNSRLVNHGGYSLWSKPYQKGVPSLGKATKLTNKLVQLNQVSSTPNGTYFKISRRGHQYGWLSSKALRQTKEYVLPYSYTSQLYPLYAPNACEAASLKMTLSIKGIATHTSLKTLINKMPKSSNPNKGFNGNPYKESPSGVVWTIYPKPLTAFAKKYDAQPANITGASKRQLISEVKRGNGVITAGSWHYQSGRPYHVLALVGYKPGKFLVADPFMHKSWSNKSFWVSTNQFMKVFSSPSRHSRAVVIR